MIVYFADRQFNILGMAGNNFHNGITLYDDCKVSEIETGTTTFSFTVSFSPETRKDIERKVAVGNYVLGHYDNTDNIYTIIDTDADTGTGEIVVYAEDIGLDLLNQLCEKFPNSTYEAGYSATCKWYMEHFLEGSGFVLGDYELDTTTTKVLQAEESTLSERILKVAELFDAEISYSFQIEGLRITKKMLNVYQKMGADKGVRLIRGKHYNGIKIKSTISNIATAILPVGATLDGGFRVNLDGMTYDDGDFYIGTEEHDGITRTLLYSRTALEKWGRYVPGETIGMYTVSHVVKAFQCDAVTQEKLLELTIEELKKNMEPAVNYEIEDVILPSNCKLGDYVYVLDNTAKIYIKSRILKIEEYISEKKTNATLGEHLILEPEIPAGVASALDEIRQNANTYTWVAFADDEKGTGITTIKTGKTWMGKSYGHYTQTPILTDPSIYEWEQIPSVSSLTFSNPANVTVEDGLLGQSASSSMRYKENIHYITNEDNGTAQNNGKKLMAIKGAKDEDVEDPTQNGAEILSVPIASFNYKKGYITGEKDYDYSRPVLGFIAEDLDRILPEAVVYKTDEKGEKVPESWSVNAIVVRMLYVLQQQQKEIMALKEQLKGADVDEKNQDEG